MNITDIIKENPEESLAYVFQELCTTDANKTAVRSTWRKIVKILSILPDYDQNLFP